MDLEIAVRYTLFSIAGVGVLFLLWFFWKLCRIGKSHERNRDMVTTYDKRMRPGPLR